MNFISHIVSYFERYLTLERVQPTRTYNYAARKVFGYPMIDVTLHRPKCKIGESWMYVAIPVGANLGALHSDEKLYVGAQTQDRMFRGDDLDGENFHHEEMRQENGDDNPVNFLRSGKKIEIHRISEVSIGRAVTQFPELSFLDPLLRQPRTRTQHTGYWFEQFVLLKEQGQWRWNTATANKRVGKLVGAPAR